MSSSASRDPDRACRGVLLISNCQRPAGVSFSSFLIKQVVAEVCREMPRLATFVTLSPAPNFAGLLARQLAQPSPLLAEADRAALTGLEAEWWDDPALIEDMREPMLRAAAAYFVTAHSSGGAPLDSVARFHLGNGARLERLNWPANLSERARKQSFGLLVNYLYHLVGIEEPQTYAQSRSIIAAGAIRARPPPRSLAQAAG
jgi:malonyl-CoA decarboxylase